MQYGKLMIIMSGYCDLLYFIEVCKVLLGVYVSGCVVDIVVCGGDVLYVIELVLVFGFIGFGVNQKGGSWFLYFDDLFNEIGWLCFWIWSY